jgi:DNA-binding NarL/FixJ family response regulator
MPSSARVLVVDDHGGWRRGVCSVLRSHRWHVAGEAGDGMDAVQKANELAPDVILLDIELPRMSGLEAARNILASHPRSKILFVSGHRTWDIVEAAFATGGRGYLLKADVGGELLAALTAVADGERYASGTLTGRSPDRFGRCGHKSRCHEAGLCSEDSLVLDAYVRFGKPALDAGKTFIVVGSEPRRSAVQRQLETLGVDVERAVRERRYLSLDMADVLSQFMVDGWPDEERFWKAAVSVMTRAAAAARCSPPGVAACGECAPTLLRDGSVEAAIRLEHLWDTFARTFNVDILCPYSGGVEYDHGSEVFHRISGEHSAVYSR